VTSGGLRRGYDRVGSKYSAVGVLLALILLTNNGSAKFTDSTSPVSSAPAQDTTSITLAFVSPQFVGTTVFFDATVISASGNIPSGQVNFFDGETLLGSGTLNNAGRATFSTNALSIGMHSITAAYLASGDFGGSTSAPAVMIIRPREIVLGVSFTRNIVNLPSTVIGLINLSQPASVDDIVTLSSDNPAVQVPASITIPAKSFVVGFLATTSPVPSQTVVTVTATFNLGSASGSLTLVPGLHFLPVNPCRVVDTRNPDGPLGGPFLHAFNTRLFAIPNAPCGVPAEAQAYSLNITVVPHGSLGFLTVFPCDQPRPLVSTLNSTDGRIKAAAAIVPAGTLQSTCIFVTDDSDVIIDVNGFFTPPSTPSSLAFYPVAPCRLVDTRNATAPLGGPLLNGGETRTFPLLSGSCNLPAGVQAYSLNFTSVPRGPLGFLTAWPAGQTQPLVSTLNAPTGAVTANAAIVPAGANGDISIFVTNTSDLVIDVNGYFAPPTPTGLALYNLVPCRVIDTRNPSGATPFDGTLNVNVTSSNCGAPPSARAYVFNATVVPPGPLGFLTLWPQDATQPLVSTLNANDGSITSNMAIVPSDNGDVSVFVSNPSHLILDIPAFFAP